jgi:hypothetical protein
MKIKLLPALCVLAIAACVTVTVSAACCYDIVATSCEEAPNEDIQTVYESCEKKCGSNIFSCTTKYGVIYYEIPAEKANDTDGLYASYDFAGVVLCAEEYQCADTSTACTPPVSGWKCRSGEWNDYLLTVGAYGVGECPDEEQQ